MHCSEPGNLFKFNTRATISQVDFVLRSANLFYPQKALAFISENNKKFSLQV